MRNRNHDLETSLPDLVSAISTGFLGLTGLAVAIVGAVTGLSALAIIAGSIAVLLAGISIWLLHSRRQLVEQIQTSKADIIRLEAALSEQVKAKVEAEPDRSTQVKQAADAAGLTRVSEALSGSATTPDLMDARTGLLGEQYFRVTLDGRVASARRHLRPLALILLDVIEGASHESPSLADPVKVASIARDTLRDADTLCRLDDGRFAMILEDTPENGAIWTVERIRRRINEDLDNTTAWAGVACYPAHGFDGPEVLAQAMRAITAARDWRQDRTEVAEG